MTKKQQTAYTLFLMAAVAMVLVVFSRTRTFDELIPVTDNVSVTAYYWHSANAYTGAKWEAGSPEAQQVLELLRGTTYRRSLVYELIFRTRRVERVNQMLNGNSGVLTLVLQGESTGKYTIGFQNGTISFDGYNGFNAEDEGLYDALAAMMREQAG